MWCATNFWQQLYRAPRYAALLFPATHFPSFVEDWIIDHTLPSISESPSSFFFFFEISSFQILFVSLD